MQDHVNFQNNEAFLNLIQILENINIKKITLTEDLNA